MASRSFSSSPLRIVHIGLGQIGIGVINSIIARGGKHSKLVAAVDSNPSLAGKKLREFIPDAPNLIIEPTIESAVKRLKGKRGADVATLTTGSTTKSCAESLMTLSSAGLHVVTSCEELSYPALRSKSLTAKLDKHAAKNKTVIIGTGVNPGFAMDCFALACTAPCTKVRSITVTRSLDATKRRYQLQKKIGVTMDIAAVEKLIQQNAIGHVGLRESIAIIAAGLGWKLTRIEEKFSPIVADRVIASEHFRVEPGQCKGLSMLGYGRIKNQTVITLDLTMAFGVDTFDQVQIDGDPPLTVRTTTGFPGEASTVGMIVNCVDAAPLLTPGVRTMLDLFRARSIRA
jgi:4-hydroxy-tetrahydrodipicolinate reductase